MIYKPRTELDEVEYSISIAYQKSKELDMLNAFMELNRVLYFNFQQEVIDDRSSTFDQLEAENNALKNYISR